MATSLSGTLRERTSDVTIEAVAGGSLSPGSGFFWVWARNRVGQNLLSDGGSSPSPNGFPLSWLANQKVVTTFSADSRRSGEDVFEFGVAFSATDDPTTAKQIATIRARDAATVGVVTYPGLGVPLTLPLEIELTNDDHLAISASVANSAALPANPVHGMIRLLSDTGTYLRWESDATSGELAANGGFWVIHSTGFSAYVADITQPAIANTSPQGAHRPLNQIEAGIQTEEFIAPPPYPFDGSRQSASVAPIFHLSNGSVAGSGSPIAKGTRIETQWLVNGSNRSIAFAGQAIATLLGRVDRSSGILDTSLDGVGVPIVLGPSLGGIGGLTVPADLPQGFALAYQIQLQTDASAIATPLNPISQGDLITYYPKIEGVLGERAPYAQYLGSGVSERGNQLIVVPSNGTAPAIMLDGSAIIYDSINDQGYQLNSVGSRDITGLATATDGQAIALSGPYNSIRVRANDGEVLPFERKRAEVGTGLGPIGGLYTASGWSASQAISGNTQSLQIEITHPATVRGDYPDNQVAGNGLGALNAAAIVPYVRLGGTIYQLPDVAIGASPQTLLITSVGSTTVGVLPDSSSDPAFGLYGHGNITPAAIASGSSLAAGTYEFAYGYRYDGSQVTRISHSTDDGCLPLGDLNFFDLVSARGQSGFTITTADFTQPAVNSTVSASVSTSAFLVAGQPVLVEGGGNYSVDSTPDSQSVVLRNSGGAINAAPSTVVSVGAKLTPTGTPGSSAYGLNFQWSSTQSQGASNQEIRTNGALSSSTQIYVSEAAIGGLDSTPFLGSITTGSKLSLQSQDDGAVHNYQVTGVITDNGSDRTIPVIYESGSGIFTGSNTIFVAVALKGNTGAAGSDGSAATIAVGSTTTIAPGLPASVTNSGSSSAATLDFSVPRGAAGAPFGTRHNYSISTSSTPAIGDIQFNAAIASATEIYINHTDRNGNNIATILTSIPNGSLVSAISDGDASQVSYHTVVSSSSTASVTTLVVSHNGGSPTFADGLNVTLQLSGKGDQGATGAAGTDAGLQYTFDSATTSGTANGEVRANDADLSLATQLFINSTDRNNVNYLAFWNAVNSQTFISLQSQSDQLAYRLYRITGQAGTTERTLNVTHVGGNRTFTDADNLGISFFLRGDQGASGSAGISAGWPYTFDNGTTAGSGSGEIRLNNANLSSVSTIFVNATDRNGVDLQLAWNQLSVNSVLFLRSLNTQTTYALYRVDSITGTTERTIGVTFLASNGNFIDGNQIGAIPSFAGPTGAPGVDGVDGVDGVNGVDGVVLYGAISSKTVTAFPYTLISDDAGISLLFDSATAATVNVPTFVVGTQIKVRAIGAGQITFVGSGVTLLSSNGLKLRAQHSAAALEFTTPTECFVDGDTVV